MEKCACKGSFLDRLLQPTILMLLYRKPLHGFSILKEMEKSGIMDYSGIDPTGLYRTLKKMEAAGLLASEWDMSDQPRRIYKITEEPAPPDLQNHGGRKRLPKALEVNAHRL